VFRGEASLNVDPKGRLAVPSRYRERLSEECAGRLIVTISLLERCLVVYPYPDWQRIEDDVRKLPALDPKAQAVSHLLIGHATECELDGHGRVLLPQLLRDFARLEKRARVVGQGRKFEIWDEDAWSARREEFLGQIGDIGAQDSEVLRSLVL